MFVDAAAIVAIVLREAEAQRCSDAIRAAETPFTNAVATWEAAVALARPDKAQFSLADSSELVRLLLEEHEVEVRQLPPPEVASALSIDAAIKYRTGRSRLNLADCFHYACAKHYGVPILSTADEFRFTDLETVP
jgi:ribonuclease VapC